MCSRSTTAGARRVPIALLMLTGVVAILQAGSASTSMRGAGVVQILTQTSPIGPYAQTASRSREE